MEIFVIISGICSILGLGLTIYLVNTVAEIEQRIKKTNNVKE